jgi:hypothetical protein
MDDIGFLEFETSHDLFKKLTYDYEQLLKVQNSNNYMNFIFVANHLKEWIEKDNTFFEEVKQKAKTLLEQSNYKLFKDLANRSKHFILDPTKPYFKHRKTETRDEFLPGHGGFDFSIGDMDDFSFGIDVYRVEQDGKLIDLFSECKKIYEAYKHIFEP